MCRFFQGRTNLQPNIFELLGTSSQKTTLKFPFLSRPSIYSRIAIFIFVFPCLGSPFPITSVTSTGHSSGPSFPVSSYLHFTLYGHNVFLTSSTTLSDSFSGTSNSFICAIEYHFLFPLIFTETILLPSSIDNIGTGSVYPFNLSRYTRTKSPNLTILSTELATIDCSACWISNQFEIR